MPYYKKQSFFKALFTENVSYKLVALFISFVLWISILSRRDFVATKEVELNLITGQGYSVSSQSADRIKIKISGSQPLMKKYKNLIENLSIDVSDRSEGIYDIDIIPQRFEVPQGMKVLSVRPNLVKFEIVKSGK